MAILSEQNSGNVCLQDPRLPRELERQIFEFAAQIDMATKLRLVLVARRVRIWLVALFLLKSDCLSLFGLSRRDSSFTSRYVMDSELERNVSFLPFF